MVGHVVSKQDWKTEVACLQPENGHTISRQDWKTVVACHQPESGPVVSRQDWKTPYVNVITIRTTIQLCFLFFFLSNSLPFYGNFILVEAREVANHIGCAHTFHLRESVVVDFNITME